MHGGWGQRNGRVLVCERMCWVNFAGRLKVLSQSGKVQWIVFRFEGKRGEALDERVVKGVGQSSAGSSSASFEASFSEACSSEQVDESDPS